MRDSWPEFVEIYLIVNMRTLDGLMLLREIVNVYKLVLHISAAQVWKSGTGFTASIQYIPNVILYFNGDDSHCFTALHIYHDLT